LSAQVEKYRPKNIDDVVGNTEAVSRLQVIGCEGNFPNVILAVRPAPAVPISIWQLQPFEQEALSALTTILLDDLAMQAKPDGWRCGSAKQQHLSCRQV
jgi:hypothetical protein